MVTYSNSNNNNLSCNLSDIFRHFETDSCSNFIVVGPILKFWSGSGFSLHYVQRFIPHNKSVLDILKDKGFCAVHFSFT